jgi:hypothetical protein
VAGGTSMAVHSLVDFPFYIPVCVLMYGALIGLNDAIVLRAGLCPAFLLPDGVLAVRIRRALVAAVATVAVWILALPVAAEGASAFAQRQWRGGNGESAAFWFEAARRLDRRDWRYHWYAGQFWMAQAAGRSSRAAARLADAAFSAGFAANPREAQNLYSRIVLHSRLRALLPSAADAQTMRNWANHAVELAPTDAVVRAERERVFKQFEPSIPK